MKMESSHMYERTETSILCFVTSSSSSPFCILNCSVSENANVHNNATRHRTFKNG